MGVFDLLGGIESPEEALADKVMKRYFGYKTVEKVTDDFFDDDDEDLEHESKVLDVAMKKRAMGIPYDSDDFEKLVNEGRYIRPQHAAAIFGVKASNLIPEPGFMKPKTGGSLAGQLFGGTSKGSESTKLIATLLGATQHGRAGIVSSILRRRA